MAVQVPEHAAARCAAHLHTRWRDGRLLLRQGADPLCNAPGGRVRRLADTPRVGVGATSCLGYSTYGKTLSAHDAQQQATHTLLMTNTLLPLIRDELPGFGEMEQFLVAWLHETYGVVVELYFAHALRQSTLTVRSTGFDVHQDTEDFPFIEFTVVVKLTPDAPGTPPEGTSTGSPPVVCQETVFFSPLITWGYARRCIEFEGRGSKYPVLL